MSNNVAIALTNNSTNLPVIVGGNGLFAYFQKIKSFPILSQEEEMALIIDYKKNNNLNAAHKLVLSHLRLAAKISLSYKKYGLAIEDIISEANMGLMHAVKKFDLEKKVRLSTYAMLWIKAAINDYVLRSWSLVKIGTVAAQKKLFYNLNKIKARLGLYENKNLEPKVVKEIAQELLVEEKHVIEMNQRLGGDVSLNVTVGDDAEYEKIDMLVDAKQNIEMSVANKQEALNRHKVLANGLAKLSDREADVIRRRMLTDNPQTLESIGEEFGVSRERVRQIEKRAFEKLSAYVCEEVAKNK